VLNDWWPRAARIGKNIRGEGNFPAAARIETLGSKSRGGFPFPLSERRSNRDADGTREGGGRGLTVSAAADAASGGVVHLGASTRRLRVRAGGDGDFFFFLKSGDGGLGEEGRDGDDESTRKRRGRLRLLVGRALRSPVFEPTAEPVKFQASFMG